MEHDIAHAGLDWGDALLGVLSLAFGAWSFFLRQARADLHEIRDDFRRAMSDITTEIKELRRELGRMGERVARVEFVQSHYHGDDPRS